MDARRSAAVLLPLVAIAMLGGSAALAGDPDPGATVSGFVADVLAGKPPAELVRWWDAEGFARRVFVAEWDGLDGEERAEIASVAAEAACRTFARNPRKHGPPGEPPPVVEYGTPRIESGCDGISVVRTVRGTRWGSEVREALILFLVARVADGLRIVDWGVLGEPTFGEGLRDYRQYFGTSTSPLLYAWRELASMDAERPAEAPPTSALYKPRSPQAPEWFTRDLAALNLPVVAGAEPGKPLAVADGARWGPSVVVNVLPDGTLSFRRQGRRSPFVETEGRWPTPGAWEKRVGALRGALIEAAREVSAPPRLVLRAARNSRWDVVFSIAQLAASPDVGIADLLFAAQGDLRGVPLVVRFAASDFVSGVPDDDAGPQGTVFARVRLTREATEDPRRAHTRASIGEVTDIRFPALPIPGDEAAQKAYEGTLSAAVAQVGEAVRDLASLSKQRKVVGLVIALPPKGGGVPTEDVLRVADVVRTALGTEVRIVGQGRS